MYWYSVSKGAGPDKGVWLSVERVGLIEEEVGLADEEVWPADEGEGPISEKAGPALDELCRSTMSSYTGA